MTDIAGRISTVDHRVRICRDLAAKALFETAKGYEVQLCLIAFLELDKRPGKTLDQLWLPTGNADTKVAPLIYLFQT